MLGSSVQLSSLLLLLPMMSMALLCHRANACFGGRRDHNADLYKAENPRGTNDRYMRPTTNGIIVSTGITSYERREGWTMGYNRLARLSLYELDRILNTDRRRSKRMRDAMVKAEEIIRRWRREGGYERRLREAGLSRLSQTQQAAIVAYSLEFPNMYKDFNAATHWLESAYDWDNYEYQALFVMINRLVEEYGHHYYPKVVFRGVNTQFSAVRGSTIMFREITSTVGFRNEAEFFWTFGDINKRSTIFIITVRQRLDISALSEFPDEREYLLRSHERFKVTDVVEKTWYREIHLESEDIHLENLYGRSYNYAGTRSRKTSRKYGDIYPRQKYEDIYPTQTYSRDRYTRRY